MLETQSKICKKVCNGKIGEVFDTPKFIDLTGKRFHSLTVIKMQGRENGRYIQWLCKCDCGNTTIVRGSALTSGNTKGCGCLAKQLYPSHLKQHWAGQITHGMTKDRFYKNWHTMRARCNNRKNPMFKHYGGRGIKVCDRWMVFENFKEDMHDSYLQHVERRGEYNTTLERDDFNGDYSPTNCRWATRSEQALNKRTSRFVEYGGVIYPLKELAERHGLKREALARRLDAGWSIEQALSTPIQLKFCNRYEKDMIKSIKREDHGGV